LDRNRCNRRRAGGAEAGFTLVEALVTLSLFALLSVLLFGGVRFADRSVSLGTAITARAADLVAAEGFLRTQLAAAQPLMRAGRDQKPVVAFNGASDHLDLVILPPVYLARGGFHLLSLSSDGRALIARWRLTSGENEPDMSAERPTVLLENVESVSFSYFSVGDRDHSAAWHDHWQDASVLPDLISVKIVFSDGREAPELIVAPRLASGVSAVR
jgi:hypothetical protein